MGSLMSTCGFGACSTDLLLKLGVTGQTEVSQDVTPYSGVEEVEAFTPRLVAEPTWKLLLVPRELLN